MARKRHTEEQIIGILKEAEAFLPERRRRLAERYEESVLEWMGSGRN